MFTSKYPLIAFTSQKAKLGLIKDLNEMFSRIRKADVYFDLIWEKGDCYLKITSNIKLSNDSFTRIRYYIMGYNHSAQRFNVEDKEEK